MADFRKTVRQQWQCMVSSPTLYTNSGIGTDHTLNKQLGLPHSAIDEHEMARHLRRLHGAGVKTVVLGGITGGGSFMTVDEGAENVRIPKKAGLELSVVAGAAGIATRDAVRLAWSTWRAGAKAILAPSPSLIQPMPNEQLVHFRTLSALDFPVIIYDVGPRTGKQIPIEIIADLSKSHKNIVGIKEGNGDPSRFERLRKACADDFVIWSGEDLGAADLLNSGLCDGLVSVAGNIIPKEIQELAHPDTSPDRRGEINQRFEPLFRMLAARNPVNVKTAMQLLGHIRQANFRLPLRQATPREEADIENVLTSVGLTRAHAAAV